MFMHNKRLMYTVRVGNTNPKLASLMLEQFGGPQGELAAGMRYFTQGLSETDPKRKDMLMDIATEELSHLEVIGSIIVMLNKGVTGKMADGLAEAELMREITQGGESHNESLLFGGGAALMNSVGVPWTAAYVDTIGDPTADLRSNIAAEARAKIIYERLIHVTDDPGIKDALGFLMTREIAHQQSFEKAIYSINNNFPPGKLPGSKEYADTYYNLSQGPGDSRGPWNEGGQWKYVSDYEAQCAVDGGDGASSVNLNSAEEEALEKLTARLASNTSVNPVTGAELGVGSNTSRKMDKQK